MRKTKRLSCGAQARSPSNMADVDLDDTIDTNDPLWVALPAEKKKAVEDKWAEYADEDEKEAARSRVSTVSRSSIARRDRRGAAAAKATGAETGWTRLRARWAA